MPDISSPVNIDIQDITTETPVMPQAEIMPASELPPSPPITPSTPAQPRPKIPTLWIFGCITFALVCAAIYGLTTKTTLFGSTYSESDFASGILNNMSSIKSASYSFSASLNVVPRDVDAVPFVMPTGDTEDLQKKYESDVKRLGEVRMIAGELQRDSTLPETLKERFPEGGYRRINIIDPLSQKEYEYVLSEDKKDFKLIITFETDEIIEALKESQKSGFSPNPDSTMIDSRKVTFTKGSLLYGFVDTELPKPFISQISEYMSMLPVDTKGKITIATSSELKPGALADWTINIDAEGGMSDMTYKLNVDALKKNDDYFVKVNNFPALFFLDQFGAIKNKWIIIPAGTTKKPEGESTTSIEVSGDTIKNEGTDNMAEDVVQNFEKTYKENREVIFEMIKKVATAADKEEILVFKNKPRKEVIDGEKLTRYEISIQKDKLYSFVISLRENITKDPKFIETFESSFGIPKSPTGTPEEKAEKEKEIEDYFKSEEFNQIFDYIEKNNNLIIWTDSDGMPVRIENTSRIVPPDTAEVLKDKQISLVYELTLSNINSPIVVTAPTDAVSWDTIFKELNPYQDKMDETKIIAGLSSINTIALSTYAKDGSYGKKGFGLGPCEPRENTLFANEYIVEELNRLTDNNMSLAKCMSRGREGKVFLWAISVPLPNEPGSSYCIDNTKSKKITGDLNGIVCK